MSQEHPTPTYDANQLPVIPLPTNPRFKSLIGHPPYERLTVVAYAGSRGGRAYWFCRCSCDSRIVSVVGHDLRTGTTRSCGCLRREMVADKNRTHGKSGTRVYIIWHAMIVRCANPDTEFYHRYGGRGIKVCAGWMESFDSFYADMGDPPPAHSIDRKNNNGHYSCGHCPECIANAWPANCRWATGKTQCRNKKNNLLLTYEGVTKTATEWAEEKGLTVAAVISRIHRGWSPEEILFRPVGRHLQRRRRKPLTSPVP